MLVGGLLTPFQLDRNPTITEPLGGRAAFHVSLRMTTVEPDWVNRPFHSWLSTWPSPKTSVTVQLVVVVVPVLVTVTSPWNPPGHWLATRYAATQPWLGPGLVLVLGLALRLGLGLGLALRLGLTLVNG